MVVYMVGKSAQMAEGENKLPPMYKLHKRLFPVLLRLACDVDQVREIHPDVAELLVELPLVIKCSKNTLRLEEKVVIMKRVG